MPSAAANLLTTAEGLPTMLAKASWILLGAAALGAWLLRDAAIWSLMPECPFHALTGWYCAGCGSTRLMHSLLRGDLAAALHSNPLAFLFLPGILFDLTVIGWGLSRRRVFGGLLSARLLLILIVSYTILRNLPLAPFIYLAPAI